MRGAKIFVDSNTLLYTLDAVLLAKAEAAQEWLRSLSRAEAGVTNLQVLNEVASVLTRKLARFSPGDPFDQIDVFATFGMEPLTFETTLIARTLAARYRYTWWDCLLLASALELGCSHFLSEDLQDGQRIEAGTGKALTIVDPFAHTPEQILPLG